MVWLGPSGQNVPPAGVVLVISYSHDTVLIVEKQHVPHFSQSYGSSVMQFIAADFTPE
jgi:hypothetical protein